MNAAWDRAFPGCIHDAAGRRVPITMKWGLQAVVTPPWAQDIGPIESAGEVATALQQRKAPLMVLDLPAEMTAPSGLPANAWALERHTRQTALSRETDPVEQWPATRRKQWRRAEREGFTIQESRDLELLTNLHQAARTRKGISSDGADLTRLLSALLKEGDTHAWTVHRTDGTPVAGGVFHGAGDGRCIYGFGGQFRSEAPGESSRATVMLIAQAMRHAAHRGDHTFDFGGSMDPGVDRFYAEFGAERISKVRLVAMSPLWKPLLKWQRKDLFSR